jgi:hypothetical protein
VQTQGDDYAKALMAAFELRNQKELQTASSSKGASLAHFPLSMESCSRIIRSIAAVASSASLFDQSADSVFEFHEAEGPGPDNEVFDSPDLMSAHQTRLKSPVSLPFRNFRLDPSYRFSDHPSRPNTGILPFRYSPPPSPPVRLF